MPTIEMIGTDMPSAGASSLEPSISNAPTSIPSSFSSMNGTLFPSASSSPSITNSTIPSESPSVFGLINGTTPSPSNTDQPTNTIVMDRRSNLRMGLFGMTSLDADQTAVFEEETAVYIETFYNNATEQDSILDVVKGRVFGVIANVVVTDFTPGGDTMPQESGITDVTEPCEGDIPVDVIFTLELQYRTLDEELKESDLILTFPFRSTRFRATYIDDYLKIDDGVVFNDLYCTSRLEIPGNMTTETPTSFPTGNGTSFPSISSAPSSNETLFPSISSAPSVSSVPTALNTSLFPTISNPPSALNVSLFPSASSAPTALNTTQIPTVSAPPSSNNNTLFPTVSTSPSSNNNTLFPTTSAAPSSNNNTLFPTLFPTTSPAPSIVNATSNQTLFPTISTAPSISAQPSIAVPPFEMNMFGLTSDLVSPGPEIYNRRTALYIEEFYNNDDSTDGIRGSVSDVVATVTINDQIAPSSAVRSSFNTKSASIVVHQGPRKKRGKHDDEKDFLPIQKRFGSVGHSGRSLQEDPCSGSFLTLVLAVTVEYQSSDASLTPEDIIAEPFSTAEFRDLYMNDYLKSNTGAVTFVFNDLTCTGEMIASNDVSLMPTTSSDGTAAPSPTLYPLSDTRTNLEIDLFGKVNPLNPPDRSFFESQTALYYSEFFSDPNTPITEVLASAVSITDQITPSDNPLGKACSEMNLETDGLTIVFTLDLTYTVTDPSVDFDIIIQYPFSTEEFRDKYLNEYLKSNLGRDFGSVVCASEVRIPRDVIMPPSPSTSPGMVNATTSPTLKMVDDIFNDDLARVRRSGPSYDRKCDAQLESEMNKATKEYEISFMYGVETNTDSYYFIDDLENLILDFVATSVLRCFGIGQQSVQLRRKDDEGNFAGVTRIRYPEYGEVTSMCEN